MYLNYCVTIEPVFCFRVTYTRDVFYPKRRSQIYFVVGSILLCLRQLQISAMCFRFTQQKEIFHLKNSMSYTLVSKRIRLIVVIQPILILLFETNIKK